ncbi:hypothetical protein VCRA2116O30_90210 [Vibrio crassostreae]|uniref:Uncharacterized protein n=1 Tax=Vibrio crassostreae TaxID=246167 RepID=A0ABP1WNM5_9VIBR|nr:hypothetical protein VCRA2117O37_100202 [Vibrio crassostreae]CAK1714585.1 hypothetical protein VCRA2116O31_100210 [Vibrio crassostreae]CAK2220771.1 hypothetical protein VCRA2119O46_70012 [Vibrio crassostreae]CAK2221167.1 hypothetical protein VCRA2116O28_70012 [Vibrio crassostreae]CAK2221369.1 hypothetical protein VCRA2119O44_70012 [Vibrio crassostreae]
MYLEIGEERKRKIRVNEMRDTKSLRVDASKRDTGYEERKGQMRVNEMRDTKNKKKQSWIT